MIIDGQRADAANGATMEVRNPATGELVDTAPWADAEDTRRAIDAAARAFETWSKAAPHTRSTTLMRASARVREQLEEVAALLTREQGKPLRDARI